MVAKKIDYDKEYVLVYDYPPYARKKEEIVLKKGTVVKICDVKNSTLLNLGCMDTSNIVFYKVGNQEQTYSTHYGYMFALNNSKNIELLNKYHEKRNEFFKAKIEMSKAINMVDTVYGPYESR